MRKLLLLAAVSASLGCATGADPAAESSLSSAGDVDTESEDVGQASSALVNSSFIVRSFAGKCVDVGGDAYQAVGAPVFIYGCNGTTAQKLRVVEIADGTHDVTLRTNLGYCIGVRGGSVAAGRYLELQTCSTNAIMSIPTQRFALDGDAILVGLQSSGRVSRDLVVEVEKGRGVNRTPLVVGTRELDPAEDFRFGSTSFAALFPTSGFKMVMSKGDLDRALAASHWGSVIEVAPDTSIRIDDATTRELREGVTLRSNRRGLVPGSEIYRENGAEGDAFLVTGDNVRVTGLRLRGPTSTHSASPPKIAGIVSNNAALRVLVDHNEMSAWTDAAVSVGSDYTAEQCYIGAPPLQNTRIIANYIHDNSRRNAGYGVVSSNGGYPYIDGNTFTRNRHAIAANYRGKTSYTARFNLVTESNEYCDEYVGLVCWKEQDFDTHGSGEDYNGGYGGHLFDMQSNTFFPSGKNIDIRGTPCNLARISGNVFFYNSSGDAIRNRSDTDWKVQITANQFPQSEPLAVVGDFDGDGAQDDFIGTGAAWYYRPGRRGEWRLLNRFNERAQQLSFGDFDSDGRTDVRFVEASGRTQTSWGGSSPWDAPLRVIRPPVVIPPGTFEPSP